MNIPLKVKTFQYYEDPERCRIGSQELHCGDCFQLSVDRVHWKDVRIELAGNDWYLIGIEPSNASHWDDTAARFYDRGGE